MPKIFGGLDATKLPLAGGTMTGGVVLHTSGNKLTNTSFMTNTSDGSDNAYAGIHGGGAEAVGRGGALYVYGNEYTGSEGWVDVQAGNASGSKIRLRNAGLTIGEVAATGLSMNYPITLSGNVSSAGASVRNIHGNGNANDWGINCPTGGSLIFSFNGAASGLINSLALYTPGIIRSTADENLDIGCGGGGDSRALNLGGSADPSDLTRSACLRLYGVSNATYPGAHQSFANLTTRAASTAFGVCPVATGDVAEVKIRADLIAGLIVVVGTTGTVYFYDNLVARDAAWVNSSTPAAGEIGIYMSGGVLYCKPGSSWTGGSAIKIATFSQIGKA